MRIVAVTDIHGRGSISKQTTEILAQADHIIVAGDITHFGDFDDAQEILARLSLINEHVLAIPGNCDRPGVNEYLMQKGFGIHVAQRIIKNTAFYGIGGCTTSPFSTPLEYSENDIEQFLQGWERSSDVRWHVLVTHCPPFNTKLDRTLMGLHVGSKAVRSFIEQTEPDLVLCGHIHEARGVDRIKHTVMINPGPFPKHYALVTLENPITYELH